MKLNLLNEKGIDVLVFEGDLQEVKPEVLRAGVTRLLHNGKNRIVLDLAAATLPAGRLPDVFLQALPPLDQIARDLSGRIVLSGVPKDTRERLLHLSRPPVIECFADRATAIAHFLPPPSITAQAEAASGSAESAPAALLEEVKMLRALVHKWTLHRHVSTEPTADRLKIQSLEAQLAALQPPTRPGGAEPQKKS